MTATPRVAFWGLGAIGLPMAEHIAKQTKLTVWNRTQSKAVDFAKRTGARAVDTPSSAARQADIIITCLPSSVEVEEVVFGDDGIANGASSGSVLVDCTSGDPVASRRLSERLRSAGIAFMDAPVSGGVAGAQAGKLTVMCGGDAMTLDRVRPILQMFGEKVVLCGAIGCGHALKAVNNALLALHVWSTAEGLTMLQKFGVSPELALDVINASSGRSNTSMNLFPERVLPRTFPRTFRLALLDKDVRIAAHLAQETRTPAELIDLTARLFAEAHRELGEEADHVEAVKVVERRAGLPS